MANLASIHTAEALVLHNEGRMCVVELHAATLRGPVAAVPDAALHRHGPAPREWHVNLVALVVEDADRLVIHRPSAQDVCQGVTTLLCFARIRVCGSRLTRIGKRSCQLGLIRIGKSGRIFMWV